MSSSSVIKPEDVLESLMNDVTIDALRLNINNQLKANEELKSTTIKMAEDSKVLNTPGAEKQTKRELFDALRQELDIDLPGSSPMASSSLVRIAVVGDIHGFWDLDEDRKALQLLQPDLVLFTGDFGEENVPLVQSVADLPFPKAVILGNHDAWHTQKFTSKQNGVQMQLDILGDEHVGYQRLDLPSFKLSIVGGRPFSHGGDQLFRKKLLVKRYGVRDMDASAGSICRAAHGTPEDHVAIILAHNGPTGLGSQADDICGRDWADEGGDHGDPDLEQAIRQLKETAKLSLPLVVFGHMHKELESGKGNRKMVVQSSDNQTVYLNGAIVPRVKGSLGGGAESESGGGGTTRAFTLVEILDGKIKKIGESWVQVIGSMAKIVEETTLFEDVVT